MAKQPTDKELLEKEQEREQMISSSTSFLLEAGAIDSPQVKNFLVAGVKRSDSSIVDSEMLADTYLRIILVYVKLSRWGKFWKKEKGIEEHLLAEFKRVLPSFRVRIVFDYTIFEKALEKAKLIAEGRTHEEQISNRGTAAPKSDAPASSGDEPGVPNSPAPTTEPEKEPEGSASPSEGDSGGKQQE